MSGRYEREFVNALENSGEFVAMRAPSSGSATERDLPDVLAMRDAERVAEFLPDGHAPVSLVLAVEHKSTSANVAYVEPHEVAALERFAETAGAEALLGCRFKNNLDGRYHYLVRPEDARRTEDAENYAVSLDDAPDVAEWRVNASTDEVVHL